MFHIPNLPPAVDIEFNLRRHLNQISHEIGERLPGSKAHQQAADYIRTNFQNAGLNVVEYVDQVVDWQYTATRLTLSNGEEVSAYANVYSPACNLEAPLAGVGTVEQLAAANLNGRIVFLYGDLTKEALIPQNYQVYQMEGHQALNRLLIEKAPAALLTLNMRFPAGEQMIQDWDMPVPSATIPQETGYRLLDQVGERVQLKIEARSVPGQSALIIGEKPGNGRSRIVLMAHYDTKINTPGALDNGSGTAVILTLATLLQDFQLTTGIEFVIFPDEEYYGLGDLAYIKHRGNTLDDILVGINVDGAGYKLGSNTITIISGSEALQSAVVDLKRPYPGMVWVEPWPQSNHSTFAYRGVPCIAFSSTGAWELAHTPDDSVDKINPAKLREIVELISQIVYRVQEGLQTRTET